MNKKQIVAVRTDDSGITHVKLATGEIETVSSVIANIDGPRLLGEMLGSSKSYSSPYYVYVGGLPTDVTTVEDKNGRKHIRTVADEGEVNNLLSLGRF